MTGTKILLRIHQKHAISSEKFVFFSSQTSPGEEGYPSLPYTSHPQSSLLGPQNSSQMYASVQRHGRVRLNDPADDLFRVSVK